MERARVVLCTLALCLLAGIQGVPALDDPSIYGLYEYLGVSYVVGVQSAAVPGTTQFLFMERPTTPHPDGQHYNAGLMDYVTGKFINFNCSLSMENCGHTYLINGTIAVLGGHKPQSSYPEGRRGIQLLNIAKTELKSVAQLQYGHWLDTVTRLPNGMITAMSDSPSPVNPPASAGIKNPFYELWDPNSPNGTKLFQLDQAFLSNTKYFYYPFNFILPTGDMFVFSNRYGQIINPLTGKRVVTLPSWRNIPQTKGLCTAYPFSGSAVMLPFSPADNYSVAEIAVFGGQWADSWVNDTGSSLALRLKIKINKDGSYAFDPWKMEVMPSPRVSGSAVLLPNGMVLLINGAKRGMLGDAVSGGGAMLNEPNFWPVLYDPKGPEGSRFTTLTRSQIARLLHSTAGLTLNGTVLLAGGDRSDRFWSPVEYSPSPTGYPEYRCEVFVPPYVLDVDNRPTIVEFPTIIGYGDTVIVSYTVPNDSAVVDGVVLVAPPSDTHGFNMHQRIIELTILDTEVDSNHVAGSANGKTIAFRGPPNANVALPGPYMLFLLVGRTYGPGQWVSVQDTSAVFSS